MKRRTMEKLRGYITRQVRYVYLVTKWKLNGTTTTNHQGEITTKNNKTTNHQNAITTNHQGKITRAK